MTAIGILPTEIIEREQPKLDYSVLKRAALPKITALCQLHPLNS